MIQVEVAADVHATQAELTAIEHAFRRAGFDVRPEAAVESKSAGLLPWVIYVTVAAPIATFFTTFAGEAGKDAYAAVKQWVQETHEARRDSGDGTGSVLLRDSENTSLVLHSTIPDEALDALRDLDWSEVRGDYLIWNEKAGAWRDPMKNPEGF